MVRYLVTGGAGFIGSHLVEYLLGQGHQVVVLDDFSTGRRENLEPCTGHPNLSLLEGDIRDPRHCARAVEGVEYVLHQAALGSVPRSVADPVTTNAVNIEGTLNLLVAARDAGVRRFVYASSSSIYGDSRELPKVEERIGSPLSPYAVTKHANELYAGVFWRTYGLECIGLRYFNVFGPRQDTESSYAAVIPLFVRSLLAGEPPAIFGDGEQTRDFTYVENVVQANLLACHASSRAVGEAFNVAGGRKLAINELFRRLAALLDCDVEPRYGPEREGDVRESVADLEKARKLLGYRPLVDVEEGLAKAIEWYRAHLHPDLSRGVAR